jgi:hypothetical protein
MGTPAAEQTEYAWVSRLREAGYDVRTGTGTGGLSEEPDCSFSPPPGFRPGFRAEATAFLGRALTRGAERLRRLLHAKPHATLP